MDNVIPELTTEPITRRTLALFAGASGDHNPIHIDLDFAREAGMDDVIAHGMLSMAYVGRMLTNWIPQTALREFSVRFVAITHVHDSVRCTGRIVETFEREGEILARIELQAATRDGNVTVAGEAAVALQTV